MASEFVGTDCKGTIRVKSTEEFNAAPAVTPSLEFFESAHAAAAGVIAVENGILRQGKACCEHGERCG